MSADPMPIEDQVRRSDHEVHLRLTGELDLATAPAVEALCYDALDSATRRIVLDFEDVDFVDSAGLAALVAVRNRLHADGGVLALRSPNGTIRRLLSLTRIDEIVEIC